jgi:glycosyltransferase involved in cell wall biosynthesis
MPPMYESRLRTIKFAKYLTELGYQVTIFSSSFLHNHNINLIEDNISYEKRVFDKLQFVLIKTIGYKRNGIVRLLNLIQFHLKLYFLRKEFDKPDVIVHTALPPFGNLIYFVAKQFKSKYIAEVLDLWPESFVDMGILSKKNLFVRLSYLAEKWLYKQADKVVFSMEGGKDYIVEKKWDKESGAPVDLNKVHYINNGIDLNDFNYNVSTYQLDDEDLNNETTKKVVYIGSMRLANNLNELIDAAYILKDVPDVKFLLFGDGDDREILEKRCQDLCLNNVVFKHRWVDPIYVPYILSKSTVNILNYKSGSFGKYGGSQSKLFQYIASGKPICSNIKMRYCLVNKYTLGIAQEFEKADDYAHAILSLVHADLKTRDSIYATSQEVVNEYDYKMLTNKLIELF